MVKYDYMTGEGSVTPEQATRVNFYNYLASSSQKPRPASEALEVFSKINIHFTPNIKVSLVDCLELQKNMLNGTKGT